MNEATVNDLIRVLEELVEQTSPNPLNYFFGPAFATFFGAMFAFLLASYRSKLLERQAATRRLALEVRQTIAELHKQSIQYWSTSNRAIDSSSATILEFDIISKLDLVRRLSSELNRRADRRMARSNIGADLKNFNRHYFSCATGGSFQTKRRDSSPEKIRELNKLAVDAMVALGRLC